LPLPVDGVVIGLAFPSEARVAAAGKVNRKSLLAKRGV